MAERYYTHLKYDEGKLAEQLALEGVAAEDLSPYAFQAQGPTGMRPSFAEPEQADAFAVGFLRPLAQGLAQICAQYGLVSDGDRLLSFVAAIFARHPPKRRQALAKRLFEATKDRAFAIETDQLGFLLTVDLDEDRISFDAGLLRVLKEGVSAEILLATLLARVFFGYYVGQTDEETLTLADAENTLALFDSIEAAGHDPAPLFHSIFRTLHGVREPVAGTSFSYVDCLQANVKKREYAIPDLIGGRYKPLAVLGEGGMGIVFLAKNEETGSKVAVKITKGSEEDLVRFIREVRLIRDVNHPYVIGIESFNTYGESGERHAYYAMRYCPWPTLKDLLDEGIGTDSELTGKPSLWRRNPEKHTMLEYLGMLINVLMGLEAIHNQALAHRDIKPENIKFDPQTKTPIIMDFGLVKSLRTDSTTLSSLSVSGATISGGPADASWGQTRAGSMMGTPGYMSPEQSEDAARVDERTDLFAAGAMLYEFMTGERPFEGRNMYETISLVLTKEPTTPSQLNSAVDRALEQIILKSLEKDPANRYQTAEAMRGALEEYARQAEARRAGGGPTAGHAKKVFRVPKKGMAARRDAAAAVAAPAADPAADRTVMAAPAPDFVAQEKTGGDWSMAAADPAAVSAPSDKSDKSDMSDTVAKAPAGKAKRFALIGAGVVAVAGLIAGLAALRGRDSSRAADSGKQALRWTVYEEWPFDGEEAVRRQRETAEALGMPVERTVNIGGVDLPLTLIPAGEFMMGGTESADEIIRRGGGRHDWYQREQNQRRVRITHPFYLGTHELTQKLWQRVMGKNPSQFQNPKNPVENISWNDAQAFLEKLNAALKGRGATVRLPTEAEWEWACRAGTDTSFYFGESVAGNPANWDGEQAWDGQTGPNLKKTMPVGSYPPNPWGLHDMAGNVYEYCQDWFAPYASADETLADPVGPFTGQVRIKRGGSWKINPSVCRSSYRSAHGNPSRGCHECGMRIVLDLMLPAPDRADDPVAASAPRDDSPWKGTWTQRSTRGGYFEHWAAAYDTKRGLYLVVDRTFSVFAYALSSDTWETIGSRADGAASFPGDATDTGLTYCPVRDGLVFLGRGLGTTFFCMTSRKWRSLTVGGGTRPTLSSGGGHVLRLTVWMPGIQRRFSRLDADSDEWVELGADGSTLPQSGIALPPVGLGPGNIMAYDSKRNRFVAFFEANNQGNTWSYDPVGNQWSELSPTAQPPPRGRPSLCYDAGNDLIVMHGGRLVADTWVFDANRNAWFELTTTAKIPGFLGGIEYHAAGKSVLAFGRERGLAELWTLTIKPNQ